MAAAVRDGVRIRIWGQNIYDLIGKKNCPPPIPYVVSSLTAVITDTEWKDILMELLLRILSLVDDRTAIVASGICCGWRDVICLGLTWKKNMNNLVLSLAPKFTKLQTLILRQENPQLEDSTVETIANFCHHLQETDLNKSFKFRALSDGSLYALACGCSDLTKLNIRGCTSFSQGRSSIGVQGPQLTDRALQAIGRNCNMLQTLNLGWCDNVGDESSLRVWLCSHNSVIALASKCLHLRSLDLYYCRNITDGEKNKPSVWDRCDEEGLTSLNISQCTALSPPPPAVQALCDTFPALHTCSGRHTLVMSGRLNLTSVHCTCLYGP
ncbi:hypothetical protein GQ457_03G032190 [Hibiscus cannabinus]